MHYTVHPARQSVDIHGASNGEPQLPRRQLCWETQPSTSSVSSLHRERRPATSAHPHSQPRARENFSGHRRRDGPLPHHESCLSTPPPPKLFSLSPGLHTITSGPACTRPSTRRVARLPEPEPVSTRPRDSAAHSVPNMWLHAPCILRSADPIRPVLKLPVRWSRSITMPPLERRFHLTGCYVIAAPGLGCARNRAGDSPDGW